MCLTTKEGIWIADEDIHVCKEIGDRLDLIFKKLWNSPHMDTWHKFNEILEAVEHLEQRVYPISGVREINEGFHAYTDTSKIDGYMKVHAIIPKGSEYCRGNCGDIVSNRLIVFSSNWRYKRYVFISKRAKKNS